MLELYISGKNHPDELKKMTVDIAHANASAK
jgi:hypothetical protein